VWYQVRTLACGNRASAELPDDTGKSVEHGRPDRPTSACGRNLANAWEIKPAMGGLALPTAIISGRSNAVSSGAMTVSENDARTSSAFVAANSLRECFWRIGILA